jgi:hypothetical protein
LAHRNFFSIDTDKTVFASAPCRLPAMKAKDIMTARVISGPDLALLMARERLLR